MNKTEKKFGRKENEEEKKLSWFQRNRCAYTHNDNQCAMLGTISHSAGPDARFYCSYHDDLLKEKSGNPEFKLTKEHFEEWMKEHIEHLATRDQFCVKVHWTEDGNPIEFNETYFKTCWYKVNCGEEKII